MKIIISKNCPQAMFSIGETLRACAKDVVLWDSSTKPVFDMFDEHSPEMVILGQEDLTDIVCEAVKEHKPTVILYSVFVPPSMDNDLVSLICYGDEIRPELAKNISENVPLLKLEAACNLIMAKDGTYDAGLECDVFYYANNQSPYFLNPAFGSVADKYAIKMAGPRPVPIYNYLGDILPNQKYDYFSSAKISICDRLDDAYDAFYSGSLPIVPNQPNIPDCFLSFGTAESLDELLDKHLNVEKLRRKLIKVGRRETIKDNTYFDRLCDIDDVIQFGLKEEALLVKERCRV